MNYNLGMELQLNHFVKNFYYLSNLQTDISNYYCIYVVHTADFRQRTFASLIIIDKR